MVLSSVQDETFERNMYDNFGDVGSNVATMVGELQQKDRKNKKIESLGTPVKRGGKQDGHLLRPRGACGVQRT